MLRDCHESVYRDEENALVGITNSEDHVEHHDWVRKGSSMNTIFSFVRRWLAASRTLVGVALIIVSVVGVVSVVRLSTPGDRVIMANSFLPVGTVITEDVIEEGRVSSIAVNPSESPTDVIGRVVGSDIGGGEIITARLLEPISSSRVLISVPLGVTPPPAITSGTVVDLWSVNEDADMPPITVARNAVVVSVTDSGFGGDSVLTVLVDPVQVDRVLGVLGSSRVIVATSGESR